jgi:pyrroline-5-carboxylate reductase
VKPDIAESVCAAIAPTRAERVLSIVAGLSTERLEAALGSDMVVVRAMPNTPVLVGAGISVISGGVRAHSGDLDWAEHILSAVGTVIRLPERLLHIVTGLSGSGPAYIFLIAEALIEAGVSGGLTRETSRELVTGTLLGSARLLAETGESPEKLRADITSPAGTTAAGLRALEARAVRSALLEAVASATERSRQLGH